MQILLALLLATSGAPQMPPTPHPATPLLAPTWLAGCWKAEGAEEGSTEVWMPLAGGSMLGMSRTVKNGQTIGFEYMQIRVSQDGKSAFFAQPSGAPPTRFGQLQAAEKELVFEDPAHDFPQRVVYRLEGTDRLLGRIEGTIKGEKRSIDFPFQRVSCEGLVPSRVEDVPKSGG